MPSQNQISIMNKLEQKLADQILKEANALKPGNNFDAEKRHQLIITYGDLITAASKRSNIVPIVTPPAGDVPA